MSKKVVEAGRTLVTHNDLDGVGCAIVYNKCFPGSFTKFSDYAEIEELIKQLIDGSDIPIMLSDLSIKSEELCEKINKRGSFEMIDHHPTSKWIAEKYTWALVDTKKSATMLMYEVMATRFEIVDLLPLVKLIDNYDMWGGGKGPSKDALNINRLLGVYGVARFFGKFMDNPSVKLNSTDKLLLELKETEIQNYMEIVAKSAALSLDAQGNKYAMITVDRHISEACNRVLAEHEEIEYVMAIDFIANKVSLRGRGGLDLGMMAKSVGGGGHKQSAGFPIQHGSQLRMVLACQGECPVTERLEAIINDREKS